MTTGLTRGAYSPAYLAALPEPEPVPDAMFQFFDIVDTAGMLRAILAPRVALDAPRYDPATVAIGGESFVYYNPDNLNDRVSPDCYVAFDVDADAIVELNGYFIWLVGKPPDFVLEIASPSTANEDLDRKRALYAAIGVNEYWRYDATGGDLYGRTLAGERLDGNEYRPLPMTEHDDGEMRGYSPTLDLIIWGRPWHLLRFIDPRTGSVSRILEEEQAAHDATALTLGEERAAHDATTRTLGEERAAHDATTRTLGEERAAHDATARALAEERAARAAAEARAQELEQRLSEAQSGRSED